MIPPTVEPNIGLFDNRREANLSSIIAMVEDVLIELGHYLNECRVEATDAIRAWQVIKGSAAIHIRLIEDGELAALRLESPLMTIDPSVDRAALFQHLLELNHRTLRSAAFAMRGDEVLLVSERSTLDLDRSEVLDLLARVQRYADDYDDRLVAAFGGRLGGASTP